jgi:single-strand DNA-binding protein
MAGSVNKVILIGNVGRDPEVRTMQNGGKVVSFSLATSETWNDRASGERKEKTQWHRIAIFNEKLGEVAEKYVRKGTKLYLEGSYESRKYTDKEGHEREAFEVVLGRFRGDLTLLDSRADGGGERAGGYERAGADRGGGERGGAEERPARAAGGGRGEAKGGGASWDAPGGGDLDDEIPF